VVDNVDNTNVSNLDDLAAADNQSVIENEPETNEPETIANSDNADPVQVDPSVIEDSSNNIPNSDLILEPGTSVNDASEVDSLDESGNAEVITTTDGNNLAADSQTPSDNEAIATDNLEVQPEAEIAGNNQGEVPTEIVETENDREDSLDSPTESVVIENYDRELYDDDDDDDD